MKLTIEHLALIEQIRQGTPLENDIDDVELLNKVIQEVSHPGWEAKGRHKFYYLYEGVWDATDGFKPNAIKLSAFKTKMVSVEDVKDFFFYKANLEDNNWVRFKHQDITTFLNEKGI